MRVKKQGSLLIVQNAPVFTETAVVSHFDDPLGRMLTEYDEYLEGRRPYESLRVYIVEKETPSGSQIISIRLTEEERRGLTVPTCPICMTCHGLGYCEPGPCRVDLPVAHLGRYRPGKLRRLVWWLRRLVR
jgi:hypothetical protein